MASTKTPARSRRETLLDKILAPLTQAEREQARKEFLSGISKDDMALLAADAGLAQIVLDQVAGIKKFSGIELPVARQIRLATFGDSTANFASIGGAAGAWDQQYMVVPAGISSQTTLTGYGTKLLVQRLYPSAYVVGNGGISGETTSQMIARDGNAASSTRNAINDVLSLSPDVIIYRGGSINDILGLSLSGANATENQLNTICDRHMRIALALRAGGPVVIDEGVAGYDGGSGITPANVAYVRDAVVRLNAKIKAAHAALGGITGLIYLDPMGLTCADDGSFIAGSTGTPDKTHLSVVGQYRVAKKEAAILTQLFGASRRKTFQGKNLLDSLAYWPEGGALPTGFAPTAGNCTLQGAVIERDSSGEICWRSNVNNVASGAYVVFVIPFNIYSGAPSPSITCVSGDKYAVEIDYEVETADGSNVSPAFSLSGRLDVRNSAGGRMLLDFGAANFTGDQGDYGSSRVSGHSTLVTRIDDVTANLASTTLTRVMFNLPVLAAGYIVRCKNPSIVKVA